MRDLSRKHGHGRSLPFSQGDFPLPTCSKVEMRHQAARVPCSSHSEPRLEVGGSPGLSPCSTPCSRLNHVQSASQPTGAAELCDPPRLREPVDGGLQVLVGSQGDGAC